MKQPVKVWTVFSLCLLLLFGATASVTFTVLRYDRTETDVANNAALEESLRLALWRMDAEVGAIIAAESARPVYHYDSFYPAPLTYTRLFNEIEPGDVLMPSPLLAGPPPFIRCHFELAENGELASPQAPVGNKLDLAETKNWIPKNHLGVENRIKELAQMLDCPAFRTETKKRIPKSPVPVSTPTRIASENLTTEQRPQRNAPFWTMQNTEQTLQVEQQQKRTAQEFQSRAQRLASNVGQQGSLNYLPVNAQAHSVCERMTSFWLKGDLFLARRAFHNGKEVIQGCLLDWPALKKNLLENIHDLLPNADLRPAADPATSFDPSIAMAALPVNLTPNVTFPPPEISQSAAMLLTATWTCVIFFALAAGFLLFGVLSLSERRGAFVSAVTHELRTPLTTFRLYTDMLSEDMAPPTKREQYVRRLRNEAERLSLLVENVLTYAKLEKGRAGSKEKISLKSLLERFGDRLAHRTEEAGMTLKLSVADADALILTDVSAVERILFNLTDNACKYAGRAADKTIQLEVSIVDKTAVLRMRDCGPGISPEARKRLFRPFAKSAKVAAESAHGIGLGLALSRRLAKEMGGDLRLEDAPIGASFVLTLPLIH